MSESDGTSNVYARTPIVSANIAVVSPRDKMANLSGTTVTHGPGFNQNHTTVTQSDMSALPGLDQRFSQMSLATHQSHLCDILMDLVETQRRTVPADQIDKLNSIENRLQPLFLNYKQQVSSIHSQHAHSRPTVNFIDPKWTMKEVTIWQTVERRHDPFFANSRGDPRNIGGGIHIDTREDRQEDPWDDLHFQLTGEWLRAFIPASEAVAPVRMAEPTQDDEGNQLTPYIPAVLAKPAIPERRGYPAIINGNPIAFSGPVNHKTEAGLIQYLTDSEEKSMDKIDMVQTIQNLEKYATDSGYTYKQIKDFLRRLCQKKLGPKGFDHYESMDNPNEIAALLIEIYYEVAPINKIHEVAEFHRKVGQNINATVIRLRMLYRNLFSYISKPEERVKLVEDRVSNDILGFCHPSIAKEIRRRRTYDIATCVAHPLDFDLDIINTAEQMDPQMRPTAPLFIRQKDLQRIPTIECNNFDAFRNAEESDDVDLNCFGAEVDMNAVEKMRFQPYNKRRKLDTSGNFTNDSMANLEGIKLKTPQQQPEKKPEPAKPATLPPSRSPSVESLKRKREEESDRLLPSAPDQAKADPITGRKQFYNTKANRRFSQSPMGTVTRYDRTESGFRTARVGKPGTAGRSAESRPPSRSGSVESSRNTNYRRDRYDSRDRQTDRSSRGSSRQEDANGRYNQEWKRSPSGNRTTSWKTYEGRRRTSPSPQRYNGRFESKNRPSRRRSKSGSKEVMENLLYWDGKKCAACDGPHHGATTCINFTCPRCGLKGKHATQAHCEQMRDSLNQQNVAFHRPMMRSQTPNTRTDPIVNTVLVEQQKSILDILGKLVPSAMAENTIPETPKN